ncbi:hypothetical protein, partial [Corynebacterium matruchotii]|uniref:hypothetical protein n=1 Tax=Corynebacterium matruchotii TaxID=43768 RepID=UPI0028E27F1F
MGNACEGNLLRLRLCFEACFMGWVWRIRTNECWIGRVLSFSFVLSWFYCEAYSVAGKTYLHQQVEDR